MQSFLKFCLHIFSTTNNNTKAPPPPPQSLRISTLFLGTTFLKKDVQHPSYCSWWQFVTKQKLVPTAPVSWLKPIWMFPKIVGFPPKSSILIGFSMINHPFWDTPIFGNSNFFFSSALQTARQVAGNLSFYDLDLDLGDLGGEITWSVPQELGSFFFFGKVWMCQMWRLIFLG